MNVDIRPFDLNGCKCRLKSDPKELQQLLSEQITTKLRKKSKVLDNMSGDLLIGGRFTEIDEGNFALHFMLAFLGKAWVAGHITVQYNGNGLVHEPFRMCRTFSAFTNGRHQLRGDTKFVADLVVKKTIAADSRDDLKWRLENDGNFVYRIRREDRLRLPLGGEPRSKKFKTRDFFSFNKEFAVLIRTGIPIVAALDAIIEKSEPSELNNILQQVRYDVSTGESLSEAFAKYPRIFSRLYISSLEAGEKSGDIPEALTKHVAYLNQMMALRRKVISASIYPLILVGASVAVLFLLLIYVVPAFTKTYFESGTQLPTITLLLINVSTSIKDNFLYIVGIGIALTIGWMRAIKNEAARTLMDQWLLRIPYLGQLYISYATAVFLRTVAMVLTAGAPLVESVRTAAGTLNNLFLKDRLIQVVRRITEGLGFSEALEETESFPHLAVRMIAAGESGGELEQVLVDAADFFDDEVDVRLTLISSAIEPALMIIMGLLIGFIVLAMYMPIFQLAGTIQ